jgi:hypothetical protein
VQHVIEKKTHYVLGILDTKNIEEGGVGATSNKKKLCTLGALDFKIIEEGGVGGSATCNIEK